MNDSEWLYGWTPENHGDFREINMHPDVIYRVGLFTIAWSQLEDHLNGLFAILFKLDPTYAATIYAGMNVESKIAVIQSATHQIREVFPDELHEELKDMLDFIAHVSVEWRNTIAHANYHSADTIFKHTNYGRLKGLMRTPTVESLDAVIGDMIETSRDIHQRQPQLISVMRKISAKDFDRMCAFNG